MQVHYDGWSARWDEWILADKVMTKEQQVCGSNSKLIYTFPLDIKRLHAASETSPGCCCCRCTQAKAKKRIAANAAAHPVANPNAGAETAAANVVRHVACLEACMFRFFVLAVVTDRLANSVVLCRQSDAALRSLQTENGALKQHIEHLQIANARRAQPAIY